VRVRRFTQVDPVEQPLALGARLRIALERSERLLVDGVQRLLEARLSWVRSTWTLSSAPRSVVPCRSRLT
jgi:hypothetical protein